MSIYEHFEHAQNSALLEIQTLVLICQPCLAYTEGPIPIGPFRLDEGPTLGP